MSDWKPITKDSPTEEEINQGVTLGMWAPGSWVTHGRMYSRCWNKEWTHYCTAPPPPPRPDPDREAFEKWAKDRGFSKFDKAHVRIDALGAWTAALSLEQRGREYVAKPRPACAVSGVFLSAHPTACVVTQRQARSGRAFKRLSLLGLSYPELDQLR